MERAGTLIMVDDERCRSARQDAAARKVRFRTLGCYPLSGAIECDAEEFDDIIEEMLK